MPWCEECAKYWAPSAMRPDGSCPSCGRVLDPVKPASVTPRTLDLKKLAAGETDPEDVSAPWHFKLLVVLMVLYLGWRFVQIFV